MKKSLSEKIFAAGTAAILGLSTFLTAPIQAEAEELGRDRYVILELASVSEPDTLDTEETEPKTSAAAEPEAEEDTAADTGDEEAVSESDTYIPKLYLGGMDAKITSIYADEPIICQLLKEANPDWAYDSVGLYDVALSQTAEEAFEFGLYCGDAEVTLYQADTDGKVQEHALEADGEGIASYPADAAQGRWLIAYFGAGPAVSEPDALPEETIEAEESLEGKLDPSVETQEESTASATKTPETTKAPAATKTPETTKAPSPTKTPETTKAPSPTRTPETTKAPTPTKTPEPTKAPETTAHTHSWTPVTQVVHHEATYKQVWVEDAAAWDETVVLQAAWDEQVLVQEAYDEQVLVQAAWDEPVYQYFGVCNECGHVFQAGEDIDVHMGAGCWSSWHDVPMQTGTIHHDAVYQTVHHDAVYQTVHHDAVTQAVHHEAQGHYEDAVDQAAWDETVVTGYTCLGCGASK